MSERFDFNTCWEECIKNAPLQNGIIATDRHEMKDFAEAFFNLGANYKNRDKEIDQLKAQIEELRKVIIEYEREAARERIRKRRGYAPMVRRN